MDKTDETTIPRGFFAVRVRIDGGAGATELLERFTAEAIEKRAATVVLQPEATGSSVCEGVLAVPWAEKERLRVDFNIFASEVEGEGGMRFHMESATEFMA